MNTEPQESSDKEEIADSATTSVEDAEGIDVANTVIMN